MKFVGIDLFCGAGGVTTGIEQSRSDGRKIASVVACINHDKFAIESHKANHKKTIHFTEDIRGFDVTRFPKLKTDDNTITYLWISAECTNYSNAKGGLPRDADSRTLPNSLFPYIEYLNTDYILVENVKEFMCWGDLDENGKPLSKDKGRCYIDWINKVMSYGYEYHYKILDAADYGAFTTRKRLFIIFNKVGMPVVFPETTHSKKKTPGKKRWKAVKHCLDFNDKGNSIFRDKPLSENTYKRIYAGCVKFVANGSEAFLQQYNGSGDENRILDLNHPANTVTTCNRFSLVQPEYLLNYHGQSTVNDVNQPCPTITTKDKIALVQPEFLIKYHGNGENILSVEGPSSTLSTKDRLAFIQPENFINYYNGNGRANDSIDNPLGSILTVPKQRLITAEHFIMNRQYNNKGISVNEPCFTLIASMNKRPGYLVTTEKGEVAIQVYKTDSEYVRKIKQFMAAYSIVDIKMRMLRIPELLKIQGFPEKYKLIGSQERKKKFIGNAVVPVIPKRMIEALYDANLALKIVKAA